MQFISMRTGVPFFEMDRSGNPEQVEAMKIRFFKANRITNTKRSRITKGLKKLLKIGFQMLGKKLEGNITIKFSDVLPTSELNTVQVEGQKVTFGLSSKKKAIQRLENVSEEDAVAELQQIASEAVIAGGVNPNNPPTI